MLFWHRINQPMLKWKTLTCQFKRCYFQIPHAHSLSHNPGGEIQGLVDSYLVNRRKPSDFCYNVRYFAAPVQAKPKQEEKDTSGPRINDQITAERVRVVTDDGHWIASRKEALDFARKQQLDLVEVQRNSQPPVCKIMDFHKEKYKQQVKEKDRAKNKSELTLRKGCKEVRFSGKTEAKDLKMKADMVKRLMDRGYRVKCMAMGTEDQDLGGLLTRLSALIEDVCMVESGPMVEKKQAYVIVRHVKFGPSKKGPGKKASNVACVTSSEVQEAGTVETPIQLEEEANSEESDMESEDEILPDEIDAVISPAMKMPDKNPVETNAAWSVFDVNDNFDEMFNLTETKSSNSAETQMNAEHKTASSPVEPPFETENRYGRNEPRNRFTPTKSMAIEGPGTVNLPRSEPNISFSPSAGETSPLRNSKLPLNEIPKQEPIHPGRLSPPQPSYGAFSAPKADSPRLEPQFPNQGNQARLDINFSPSTGGTRQDGSDAALLRNSKLLSNETPKQEPARPGPPSPLRPSYGAFSAPRADSSRLEPQFPNQGNRERLNINFSPSTGGTRQDGSDAALLRNLNETPKQEPARPGPPSPPRPSYGAFSATRADSSRLEPQFPNQGNQARLNINFSPSTGGTRQDGSNAALLRNSNETPKQEPARPGPPGPPRPSYGAFSAPRADSAGGAEQVTAEATVFRSSKAPANNDIPKPELSHPGNPTSPAPGYGIFSSPKANAPEKQAGDSEGNPFDSSRNSNTGVVFPNPNLPTSKSDGSQRTNVDKDGQGGWGIFSR